MDFLDRTLNAIFGTERTREKRTRWSSYWRFGRATTLLLGTCFVFSTLALEARRWQRPTADLDLPEALWRAYYDEAPELCGMSTGGNLAENPGCPASPDSPRLWSSAFSRADSQHLARVRARGNNEYWMGATLPVELLAEASRSEATHLVLGRIGGSFQVWIDGELVSQGRLSDKEPVDLEISPTRFTVDRPMQVALRITGGTDVDFLDQPLAPGLMSASKAIAFKRYRIFVDEARPFAILLIDALLGVTLLGLWRAARRRTAIARTELLCLGLFSLIAAAGQTHALETVRVFLGHGTDGVLWVFSVYYLGPLAAGAALSFSMVRGRASTIIFPILLAAPPLIDRLALGPTASISMRYTLEEILRLTFSVFGALLCVARAAYIARQRGPDEKIAHQVTSLLAFGAGVFVLGAIAPWIDRDHGTTAWMNVVETILIVALAMIAHYEHSSSRDTQLPVPPSRFHRMTTIPGEVIGIVIALRLYTKNTGTLPASPYSVSRACISHAWAAIADHGGIVLNASDDSIQAFFEERGESHALRASLASLDQISCNFSQLEHGALQGFRIGFHAGLASGPLRPTWTSRGGENAPSWSPSREGLDPIFDALRMLTIVRKLGLPWRSAALPREQCQELPGQTFTLREVKSSHGEKFNLAVYEPSQRTGEIAA